MKFYLKNMDFKEKSHFFKKIEKITKIICKHGLYEFDYQILEEEFEKLSKELKYLKIFIDIKPSFCFFFNS